MLHIDETTFRNGRGKSIGPRFWACVAVAIFACLIAMLHGLPPGGGRTLVLVAGMSAFGYCVRCCFSSRWSVPALLA